MNQMLIPNNLHLSRLWCCGVLTETHLQALIKHETVSVLFSLPRASRFNSSSVRLSNRVGMHSYDKIMKIK